MFTGFYVDTKGSMGKEERIEVERATGVPLGREEEEVIVYVAPHPHVHAKVEEVRLLGRSR